MDGRDDPQLPADVYPYGLRVVGIAVLADQAGFAGVSHVPRPSHPEQGILIVGLANHLNVEVAGSALAEGESHPGW